MLQPHIQLDGSMAAKYAILPGDPARVLRVAKQMEQVEELAFNREYRSVRGTYQGVPILVMSTGMGGPSTAIGVEELHNLGVEAAIRIGSCGALQESIGLGDLILVQGTVRDDGASKTYLPPQFPALADAGLLRCCALSAKALSAPYHVGIARTHDGFYTDDEARISETWSRRGVLGSDMETAALFTVAHLRGMKAASILNNVVLWGSSTAEGVGSYAGGADRTAIGEHNEITVALEALVRLDRGEGLV